MMEIGERFTRGFIDTGKRCVSRFCGSEVEERIAAGSLKLVFRLILASCVEEDSMAGKVHRFL